MALLKVKKYEVESLVRSPVEFNSAIICYAFAFMLLFAPGIILMTPPVAYSSSIILVIWGTKRFLEGYGITQYKKGLKKLPYYALSPNQITVSNKKLFIGKGFAWEAKHVERLRDINKNGSNKIKKQSRGYRLARWLELKFEFTPVLNKLVLMLSLNSVFNPFRPLPEVGGNPHLHAVGMYEGEHDIFESLGERVGHKIIFGTTRVGKTRFLEILLTQDIRRGDVTVVVDPKGDADLLKRVYSEAKLSNRPVYIFHLGYPDISARYNPIGEFSSITEVAGRVSNQLPSEGNSAAFKMFGWRFVNIVAQALVSLGERPDYSLINRHIFSIDKLFVQYAKNLLTVNNVVNWELEVEDIKNGLNERNTPRNVLGRDKEAIALMMYFDNSDIYDTVLDGLIGAFRYDKSYYDKIISSLAPLLEQLTTGRTAELLSPEYYDIEDTRPIFDWKSVIQQRAVVYIGLNCLSSPVVGSAVGASILADLTSTAGYLYKHGLDYGLADINDKDGKPIKSSLPKINLHLDELEAILGPEFIPMVNRAGGAGYQVTAYTQTGADIVSGIGDSTKANVIQGNFNTIIMMRVKNEDTAKILTDQLPDVQVSSLTTVTSASDSSDVTNNIMFGSNNEDRITTESVPILNTNNLITLPKGQAYALIHGGELYKLRLPLPKDDVELPSDLESIAQDMKLNYSETTPEDWFTANDYGWFDEKAEVA